jgi:hypothetical protein
MATIILRILQVIKPDADFNLYSLQRFSDDSNIDDWAKKGVYYCAETGIVIGTGNGKFEPYCDTTREQAVVVCLRAYDYFKRYESYLEQ